MKRETNLQKLLPAVRGVVLDMDGVLWKDAMPIGDLARIFNSMRSTGLKIMLATNNATMTVDQYLKKLAGFGVSTGGVANRHFLACHCSCPVEGLPGGRRSLRGRRERHSHRISPSRIFDNYRSGR